jgi:hypothetical protein
LAVLRRSQGRGPIDPRLLLGGGWWLAPKELRERPRVTTIITGLMIIMAVITIEAL